MKTSTLLVLAGAGAAAFFLMRSPSSSSAPLAQAMTFEYQFDGVTQDFTEDELEGMERAVQEATQAIAVDFTELGGGRVRYTFTLPAGSSPPPRIIRVGGIVGRRISSAPAVEV